MIQPEILSWLLIDYNFWRGNFVNSDAARVVNESDYYLSG